MKKVFFIILSVLLLTSCEEVKNYLSDSENVAGLKEALNVGTVNAAKILGKENGYLNSDVKINLPQEAQTALNTIQSIRSIANNEVVNTIFQAAGLNISTDFDQVLITAINRAAEHAAPQSVDVFKKAITNMTFDDGKNILFSSNNRAATDYLHTNTYSGLQNAFSPVIDESLETVKVGNYTALSAWTLFATQNNRLAEVISSENIQNAMRIAQTLGILSQSEVNNINSVKNVNTDLGGYVTGKALDGLFVKVGDEELKIRTSAEARVNDLLKRVFGQLD